MSVGLSVCLYMHLDSFWPNPWVDFSEIWCDHGVVNRSASYSYIYTHTHIYMDINIDIDRDIYISIKRDVCRSVRMFVPSFWPNPG